MIRDQDRSGWFGASDTAVIMGSWGTRTFANWWLEKLGVRENHVKTAAMLAGTHYEHCVLDYLGIRKRDRQIRIRPLRLRVNLDGETDIIHEVKTHKSEEFRVSKAYWMQCQVEQFAAGKPCEIVAYRLTDAEYQNYFLPIDGGRITRHAIPYEKDWIREAYLPRLRYLAGCLRKGVWPDAGVAI